MAHILSRRGLISGAAGLGAFAAVSPSQADEASTRPACPSPASGRKMKLGLVTFNIAGDWDLPTIIQRCRELGLAAVELRSTHRHGVEPDLSRDQRAEVRRLFADSGVVLWGLGTACEYHSPDSAVLRKNIELTGQFIALAADVGARGVKVRPNGLPRDVPEEKTIEQIGRALHECGRMAADAGIEIWLEVHGFETSHPPRIRRMIDIADLPNVGITWNSNPTDLCDGSVRPYFELLKDRILSVHINELVSGYPYAELFDLLNRSGYDRYALIEIQPLKSREPEDVMRFLRYYRDLWERLSQRPT